jgi:glycosyltransferase involved in cell wall biosynthesis
MKIGIDTFDCDGGKSGVGVYLLELLKRIPPSGAQYELFGWDFDRFAYSNAAADMDFISRCSINGNTANSLWHIFKYPQFAASRSYGACFFPAAHKRLPRSSPCPAVGTVHNMAVYRGPRANRERLGTALRMILTNSLRNLDRIIAVSSWVKQELMEIARVKEAKIDVVPNGVDLSTFCLRPRNQESVVLIQPFSFRRPYILYVSRIDHPVKNHTRLIEAFGIFKERTHYPHRLVFAGADNRGAQEVKNAAARSKYRSDIFFTGHFPSTSLPELYSGSDFVVFPSIYEGFGMGVLEAMASGVPVACARAASLPETADQAALYFDPFKPEDMADRMVTLATDRSVYLDCRKRGLERAQNYSWDRCAQRTLDILQESSGL